MIRIDRLLVTAPADLTDKKGIGRRELVAIRAWIKAGRKTEKRPKFKAYKTASVALALEKLFAGKCAYCESRYNRTQPMDVEHWRPKAEVELPGQKKPIGGYEWLAADWTNLLPSCIDCNRQRTQTVLRWNQSENKVTPNIKKLGKGNLFPLLDEKTRATLPDDDLSREKPFLVNPCFDDPSEFFRFRDDGVVAPKIENPATEQERTVYSRALRSIEIYALNRKGLVDERKERLLLVRSRFELVKSLIELESRLERHINRNSRSRNEATAWLHVVKELREREINSVKAWTQADQPYTLMARQFVLEFLKGIQAGRTP